MSKENTKEEEKEVKPLLNSSTLGEILSFLPTNDAGEILSALRSTDGKNIAEHIASEPNQIVAMIECRGTPEDLLLRQKSLTIHSSGILFKLLRLPHLSPYVILKMLCDSALEHGNFQAIQKDFSNLVFQVFNECRKNNFPWNGEKLILILARYYEFLDPAPKKVFIEYFFESLLKISLTGRDGDNIVETLALLEKYLPSDFKLPEIKKFLTILEKPKFTYTDGYYFSLFKLFSIFSKYLSRDEKITYIEALFNLLRFTDSKAQYHADFDSKVIDKLGDAISALTERDIDFYFKKLILTLKAVDHSEETNRRIGLAILKVAVTHQNYFRSTGINHLIELVRENSGISETGRIYATALFFMYASGNHSDLTANIFEKLLPECLALEKRANAIKTLVLIQKYLTITQKLAVAHRLLEVCSDESNDFIGRHIACRALMNIFSDVFLFQSYHENCVSTLTSLFSLLPHTLDKDMDKKFILYYETLSVLQNYIMRPKNNLCVIQGISGFIDTSLELLKRAASKDKTAWRNIVYRGLNILSKYFNDDQKNSCLAMLFDFLKNAKGSECGLIESLFNHLLPHLDDEKKSTSINRFIYFFKNNHLTLNQNYIFSAFMNYCLSAKLPEEIAQELLSLFLDRENGFCLRYLCCKKLLESYFYHLNENERINCINFLIELFNSPNNIISSIDFFKTICLNAQEYSPKLAESCCIAFLNYINNSGGERNSLVEISEMFNIFIQKLSTRLTKTELDKLINNTGLFVIIRDISPGRRCAEPELFNRLIIFKILYSSCFPIIRFLDQDKQEELFNLFMTSYLDEILSGDFSLRYKNFLFSLIEDIYLSTPDVRKKLYDQLTAILLKDNGYRGYKIFICEILITIFFEYFFSENSDTEIQAARIKCAIDNLRYAIISNGPLYGRDDSIKLFIAILTHLSPGQVLAINGSGNFFPLIGPSNVSGNAVILRSMLLFPVDALSGNIHPDTPSTLIQFINLLWKSFAPALPKDSFLIEPSTFFREYNARIQKHIDKAVYDLNTIIFQYYYVRACFGTDSGSEKLYFFSIRSALRALIIAVSKKEKTFVPGPFSSSSGEPRALTSMMKYFMSDQSDEIRIVLADALGFRGNERNPEAFCRKFQEYIQEDVSQVLATKPVVSAASSSAAENNPDSATQAQK
ncbi:MAG: hypothetical protein A3F12_03585 [Gammaproteobacteria bacterium RIFCSPHIGHO2_12_FULL_38_14]|nr:MAG: hypothetical protein A3F12_03585 [Gammaproteobacteria bacterium RIFCSPHIGHO2_12_FULL_38_14]